MSIHNPPGLVISSVLTFGIGFFNGLESYKMITIVAGDCPFFGKEAGSSRLGRNDRAGSGVVLKKSYPCD